jgi:transcriptional regulator with XRE-family HTH domain
MITADQIRAARALLRLDQSELARRAGVSLATLRRVEQSGEKARASTRAAMSIRHALETAGAEFIDGGVRCRRRRTPEEVAERVRKIVEISHQSAKLIAENPDGFSEEDLYDENGLPA